MTRLLASFLLLAGLLLPGRGWGAQTQLDSDSFTGSDATELPAYNANWNALGSSELGNVIINTNAVATGGGYRGNYRTGQTWTNDQWGEIVIGATVPDASFGRFGVVVRSQTGTTVQGYFCGMDPPNVGNAIYRIGKYNGLGTFTNITTEPGSTTPSAGDILNCQVEGDTITLKVTRGGVDAFTPITGAGGSSYSSGNPGLIVTNAVSNTPLGDDWKAGSVGAAASVNFFGKRLTP